ncbi:PepSY-associated TM helix domain-containing protein [Deinococcus hopiensis]|uniref:PepSY-associated TM helix domain-containing protein n=1 Tax=Deinococcus hopiensis TaxID=309885 RepID=UPI0009FC0102|nr:PepSY-associated TM helix domain-containing protein [Deinococcus hopiensis]
MRSLHTYTSMVCLLIVLFFSLTGITLNHPDWAFGNAETRREVKGTLPAGWTQNGQVNWLTVAEELRAKQGLKGRAGDTRVDSTEASLSFKAPGYSADAFIDMKTGTYTVDVDAQGAVAVLNDLHRGRDAGSAWAWLIDLTGVFLTVISLTGLGILFYLKKTRIKALAVMLGAGFLVVWLGHLATG